MIRVVNYIFQRYILGCIIIIGFCCQSFRYSDETSRTLSISDTAYYGQWTVHEDTISPPPLSFKKRILKYLNLKRYIPPKRMDRGIINHTFIPKGMRMGGVNIAYLSESEKDIDYFFLEDWQGTAFSFHVSPFFGYFIKDNVAIGGRFSYRYLRVDIDNLSLSFGDDLSLSVENVYVKDHTYQGSIFIRTYAGLDETRRFGLFNESFLSFSSGTGRLMSGEGESINNTHQHTLEVQLGIQPGLDVFITNEVFVEAYVKVAGVKYKYVRQKSNGIPLGNRHNSGINFKLDILSIYLGIAFCL